MGISIGLSIKVHLTLLIGLCGIYIRNTFPNQIDSCQDGVTIFVCWT